MKFGRLRFEKIVPVNDPFFINLLLFNKRIKKAFVPKMLESTKIQKIRKKSSVKSIKNEMYSPQTGNEV